MELGRIYLPKITVTRTVTAHFVTCHIAVTETAEFEAKKRDVTVTIGVTNGSV